MSRIEASLRAVVKDLDDLGCAFALVGGFAVSARTDPRTTKDVDVAVVVEGDEEAERLAYELSQRGYELGAAIEQTETERLATLRTVSPAGSVVDLLFASSSIEPELVEGATMIEILGGLSVRVASVGHLIATKILARDDRLRPQDRVDLAALFRAAGDDDLSLARSTLLMVVERGYARGRDLPADLDSALAELT